MKPIRPKQYIPAEISDSLLDCIGEMFYPDRAKTPGERKRWAQDRHWYRQRVITWAARWLDSRAVTLTPERFKQELLDKLSDIKRHAPEHVLNWPRYITKGIQDHFAHNGERIYDEGKALRHQIDAAIDKARVTGRPAEQAIDPIRVLALAHQVNKPRNKSVAKNDAQPDLFNP